MLYFQPTRLGEPSPLTITFSYKNQNQRELGPTEGIKLLQHNKSKFESWLKKIPQHLVFDTPRI